MAYAQNPATVQRLGNVDISGLSLSSAMRNDLSSGMSAAAFNAKYAGGGFQPISLARQLSAPAPTPAPAPQPAPTPAVPAPVQNVSQPLFDFSAQQQQGFQNLLNQQNTQQQGLFTQYTNMLNNQEPLPEIYQRLFTELGIPQMNQAYLDFAASQPAAFQNLLAQQQALQQGLLGQYGQFTTDQQAAMAQLLGAQNETQQGLFGQYASTLQGQEQLPALYERLQNELGIPELSQQAGAFKNEMQRVKGLLDRLDEDVTSRTSGTYTTEAMRRRMLSSEGDVLRNNLGRLGTGLEPISEMLTGAQGQLSNLMPLYMQQQQLALKPLEMEIGSLGERFAREMGGFTNNQALVRDLLQSRLGALDSQFGREMQGFTSNQALQGNVFSNMINNAQGQLGTMLPLYAQEQEQQLRPLDMQINALGDTFARQISGFTADRELQLTALMDKLNRERQLSDRDWELAQQIAAEQRDFERQRQLAAEQFSRDKQLASISASRYLGGGGGGVPAPTPAPAPTYTAPRQLPTLPPPPVSSSGVPQLFPSTNPFNDPVFRLLTGAK